MKNFLTILLFLFSVSLFSQNMQVVENPLTKSTIGSASSADTANYSLNSDKIDNIGEGKRINEIYWKGTSGMDSAIANRGIMTVTEIDTFYTGNKEYSIYTDASDNIDIFSIIYGGQIWSMNNSGEHLRDIVINNDDANIQLDASTGSPSLYFEESSASRARITYSESANQLYLKNETADTRFRMYDDTITAFEFYQSGNEDIQIRFDGTSNDGYLRYREDEDELETTSSFKADSTFYFNRNSSNIIDIGFNVFNNSGWKYFDDGYGHQIRLDGNGLSYNVAGQNSSGYGASSSLSNVFNVSRGGDIETDGQIGHSSAQTITLGTGVTTFAVTSNVVIVTGDGGGNTIATITGASVGTYTFIFTDSNVTISNDDTHGSNSVDLDVSNDFSSADDKVLQLVYDGTSWYSVSITIN
jgi:hypothetical protein